MALLAQDGNHFCPACQGNYIYIYIYIYGGEIVTRKIKGGNLKPEDRFEMEHFVPQKPFEAERCKHLSRCIL